MWQFLLMQQISLRVLHVVLDATCLPMMEQANDGAQMPFSPLVPAQEFRSDNIGLLGFN